MQQQTYTTKQPAQCRYWAQKKEKKGGGVVVDGGRGGRWKGKGQEVYHGAKVGHCDVIGVPSLAWVMCSLAASARLLEAKAFELFSQCSGVWHLWGHCLSVDSDGDDDLVLAQLLVPTRTE